MREVLETTAGDMPLEQVELTVGERTWSILHTGALLTAEEEVAFLRGEGTTRRPYGIVLWPSAIALAHDLALRELAGKRVLELGAGTGLPGIVAASLGAHVVQTDRQALVMHVCRQNAERNGVTTIVHRLADWTQWEDTAQYDVILGSDVLYTTALHPALMHIFLANLAPGGTLLIADPFRAASLEMLELMEAGGWHVTMTKWTVGTPPRPVGVFVLAR